MTRPATDGTADSRVGSAARQGPGRFGSTAYSPGTLMARVWPFAVVAVLAQASTALPPGPQSAGDWWVSIGLLVACALTVTLPWERLPSYLSVTPALLFCASALWLQLAQGGAASGVGIIILVPLLWAVLYHRRSESMVVLGGVVAVVVAMAVVTHTAATVVVRRGVFWLALGVLVVVAVHELRDRMERSMALQAEQTRRAVAIRTAAETLTSIPEPDRVIKVAVSLAASLVRGPAGEPCCFLSRPLGGRMRVVARSDVTTAAADLTDGLRSDWSLPVFCQGQLEGVLSVDCRGTKISAEDFDQLKAVGGLLELALGNALANQALRKEASTDELTGLRNRRAFDQVLDSRSGYSDFAVLMIDVDDLKEMNDEQGHAAGDELLAKVAAALAGALRRHDVMARMGGDEFAVLCLDSDPGSASRLAGRMLETIRRVGVGGRRARVSIGAATGSIGDNPRVVLNRADEAMYEAKRQGGMRAVVVLPDGQRTDATTFVEADDSGPGITAQAG